MLPARLPKAQKRETRWRSQAHLGFVRSFRCAIPGCVGMPIDAAHVRMGSGAGIGQKPDDWRATPLCGEHHRQQHSIGEPTFWATYQKAAGQCVETLIAELCDASPRRAQIRLAQQERSQ